MNTIALIKTFLTITLMAITPAQGDDVEMPDSFEVEQAPAEQARTAADVQGDMCFAAEAILAADATIEKQKQIGKASGFVDKVAMQHAGDIIVRRKAELQALEGEYKTLTGKTYNRKLMLTKCEL